MGRFHLEEINGKQYLVYYLDKPGETSSMDSGDTDNNYLSVSPLFLCPNARFASLAKQYADGEKVTLMDEYKAIDNSPYFNNVIEEIESSDDNDEKERLEIDNHHYVLPLSWCKDEKYDALLDDTYNFPQNLCHMCGDSLKIGMGNYLCIKCECMYHKECIETPPEITHPYHPNHPLQFFYFRDKGVDCGHCKVAKTLIYHCTICNVRMDTVCALKPIPLVKEKTKRHDHPLTFFTRKDHIRCNVCGLIDQAHHTYVCLKCDFAVHEDCAYFPSVIRISRHHHRISFTSSLPPGKWSCGVCRKNVDGDYGGYTCKKCDGYVIHSRCALRKDIWDGKELEGVPEEDDIEEVLDPFERRSDGLILHFLHSHYLKPETSGEVYDESKICHACVLPIYEGDFYSCVECDFILHDSCANAPRKIRHSLHPHPLTLKVTSEHDNKGFFECNACFRPSSGFVYECNTEEDCFKLDVRCGFISEPFIYQGHDHPLFLALDPQEKHLCRVCKKDDRILINCIECDFIICLKCVTIPYMVRYKHDNHFLTLVHEKETNELDWCEACERSLMSPEEEKTRRRSGEEKAEDGEDKRFYECKKCCTTLHINCLIGKTPYLKPGHKINRYVHILPNNSCSRPFCKCCIKWCEDKIFFNIVLDGYTYVTCCLDNCS